MVPYHNPLSLKYIVFTEASSSGMRLPLLSLRGVTVKLSVSSSKIPSPSVEMQRVPP